MRGARPSGAALLIALSFLLLLSAVVLALFSTSQTDRQNAAAFASAQETMRLAETAVNVVQGQIRDATIQPRVGWASQPGMVRAFTTNGSVTAHKLYSSDAMVVSGYGKTQMDAEFNEIKNWNAGATGKSFNARFADLNAPAVVKRPNLATPDPNDTIQTPVFPIADPAAIGAVEGFSADTSVAGTTLGNGTNRRLPMPVKWIYVLKDGQLTAPTGGNATKATFSGPGPVPSQSNPIVGRIAFWADDDTCKLNINTASEGSFWDTPRANTISEQRLALSIPVQGEFQRISGHPATTSLSPVFGSILPAPNPAAFISTASFTASSLRSSEYVKALDYFKLTPRISGNASDNSSQFGLKMTSDGTPVTGLDSRVWPGDAPLNLNTKAQVDAFGVNPDTDRLYATTDELLFAPGRSLNNTSITASELSRRDFFLTAHSRAPETTLFGTPRISLWPLNTTDAAGTQDRTVKDRLIAFCSTVQQQPFFFDRVIGNGYEAGDTGAMSSTLDINRPRNSALVGYLRKLSGTAVPGYGASFASKWGDPDKVIAQAVDTIRTTNVDYVDFGTGSNRIIYRYGARANNPRAEALSSAGNAEDFAGKPRGFVAPTTLSSGARGAGRFMTFAGFTIVIMPCEVVNTYSSNVTLTNNSTWTGTVKCDGMSVDYDPDLPTGADFPNIPPKPSSQQTTKARAFLLAQPYNPTPGGVNVAPGMQMEITGSLNIGGTTLGVGTSRFGAMPENRNYAMQTTSLNNPQYPFFLCGASVGNGSDSKDNILTKMPHPSAGDLGMPPVRGTLNPIDHYYPFVTPAFDVSSGSFTFGGGTLTITLKNWTGTETLQTLTVNFPATPPLPAPQHMETDGRNFDKFGTRFTNPDDKGNFDNTDPWKGYPWDTAGGDLNAHPGNYLSLWKRMRLSGDSNRFAQGIIRTGDIALGVQATTSAPVYGDLRLLALESNVPASWFQPCANYPVSSAPSAFVGGGANVGPAQTSARFSHALRNDYINLNTYGHTDQFYGKLSGTSVALLNTADITRNSTFFSGLTPGRQTLPVATPGLTGGMMRGGGSALGDWASGFGTYKDGALFSRLEPGIQTAGLAGFFQDRSNVGYNVSAGSTFEPNRMVPSAGVLGGIITPNSSGTLQAWQTLLANPVPAGSGHPGANNPPDHAFLDNFWMPVVEPYAISEPISTAGKVNLNFQMAPFSHITRNTALRGALKPLMIGALQPAWATGNQGYKFADWNDPNVLNVNIRQPLDLDETISSFASIFSTGEIYRSASEVTTVPLVPQGSTSSSVASWWNNFRLTSDTLREQPYTALLSRVTTKSNTFTVHYRVQVLRQGGAGTNYAEWDESRGIMGEYRGSTTIERYLDPNAKNIPDYTQVNLNGTYDPIDRWYRWRVLSQKQFAP